MCDRSASGRRHIVRCIAPFRQCQQFPPESSGCSSSVQQRQEKSRKNHLSDDIRRRSGCVSCQGNRRRRSARHGPVRRSRDADPRWASLSSGSRSGFPRPIHNCSPIGHFLDQGPDQATEESQILNSLCQGLGRAAVCRLDKRNGQPEAAPSQRLTWAELGGTSCCRAVRV